MEVVLDVHARDVRIKKTYQSRCCNDASSIKKKVHGEIHMLVCIRRTICSSRCNCIEDGWVNF
jgi:hypothetical protein